MHFDVVQEVEAYMKVIFWPIATMSNIAGVWTVTVVTLHRYIAVCLPHRVNKFANLRVARLQASPTTTGGGAGWAPAGS